MSPQTFMLAHLVMCLAVLVVVAIAERRDRKRFWSRSGTRYRRLSTAEMLEALRKKNR
jgi:hypothetical protein